ncbi:Ff.00g021190.m01.CDS01 [Fusarium sp. VM40]|nr:Ff.00g021190.m01.CDS01 [Fusarium sp. VM40]
MVRVGLLFILAALCLLYDTAAAQSLGSVLTDAPKCATDCLFNVLARKEFVGKNQTVICTDKQFANAIGDCLTAKCTMRQTMDFIKMSAAVCGIRPTNDQTKYRVVTIIMAALAIVFFTLRITAKVVLSLPWGLDDTLTVLSVVFMIPFLVLLQISITLGLGLDMWYLSDYQITAAFQYFIFVEVFYVIGLVLVKAAVLCFFLRIFPDNKFRVVVKCTLAFNFLMGITFFVMVFFQTRPLSLFWEGWQKKQAHLVMSGITKLTLPHAGLSLLVDVWMLILPLTQLWGLGLKLKKKLGVIAMFSVGIFLTVVAAIRISELVLFASSADLTVLNAQKAIIWSSIEICVGIMVACMPHIHHLVRHIMSRIRKTNGEMEDSNRGVFVDRSLARITMDNATGTTGPQLHDEGGLLEKNIAASATTESRNTGSLGYSSDAETQV